MRFIKLTLIFLLIASSVFFTLELFNQNMIMPTKAGFTNSSYTVQDFELTNIWDNETFTLYEFIDAGKVVLIQFMTTWCPHCHDQLEDLRKLNDWDPSMLVLMSISGDSGDARINPNTGHTKLYDDAVANNMTWFVAQNTAGLWVGGPDPGHFGPLSSPGGWGYPTLLFISPAREVFWFQLGYTGTEYYTVIGQIKLLYSSDTTAPVLF
ncbi:MAG: peroxiredoxin family protein, partial [Candidatus Hodarchaeota archaeon]